VSISNLDKRLRRLEIMSNDLEKRLERLQARLNANHSSRPGGPLKVVVIFGGLPSPGGEPLFATCGASEWIRESGEGLDPFADRCVQAARELGEGGLLVLGGLPASQKQQDVAMKAYDEWLLTDDGIPPCETHWPARRTFP
jgi:hypothetical protein